MVVRAPTTTPVDIVARSLRRTAGFLDITHNRLITGRRVNGPKEDPSSFIIANLARGRVAALNKIRDGLARATSTGDVAISALDKTIELLTQMKAKIVQAQDKSLGADSITALKNDVAALKNQIQTIVDTAEFNGVNLLKPAEFNTVAWTSKNQDGDGKGVFAQRFDDAGAASGSEFQVNTATSGDQDRPSVATLSRGGFVVAWESKDQDGDKEGIFAQRFDADGSSAGSEIQVTTTTADDQKEPAVAELSGVGFVVTWESKNQDGDGKGIFAQVFDVDGVKVGSEIQVNTTTSKDQDKPAVAELSEGGFVITWESKDQDGDGEGIFAQRFDSEGAKLGGEIQVNTTTSDDQKEPSVTALSGGGFVLTRESKNQDGDGKGVFTQVYDKDGDTVGSETQVNTTIASDQDKPSIVALADGGFVVSWESKNQDGDGKGVFSQRFDSSGAKVGSETQANTTTADNQDKPSIVALADGGFAVAWQSKDQDGDGTSFWARFLFEHCACFHVRPRLTVSPGTLADSLKRFVPLFEPLAKGIFVQRFDATATKVESETQVNTTTADDQDRPSIAALADGGFVVSWESKNQDGDGKGVFSQRFDSSGAKVGSETQANTTTADNQERPALAVGGATTLTNESLSLLIDLDGNTFTIENQSVTARSLGLEQIDLKNNADAALAIIDDAITYASRKAAVLGSRLLRLDAQDDFTTKLRDIINDSLAALVDADLSKEAAQLAAQQIRLQLSISAFNIANGNAKSVQLQARDGPDHRDSARNWNADRPKPGALADSWPPTVSEQPGGDRRLKENSSRNCSRAAENSAKGRRRF